MKKKPSRPFIETQRQLLKDPGVVSQYLKEMKWLSPETLPRTDGAEAILWLTTDKGFPDVSAHCFLKDAVWHWMDTHEVIKRQDCIRAGNRGRNRHVSIRCYTTKTKPLIARQTRRMIFRNLYYPTIFIGNIITQRH